MKSKLPKAEKKFYEGILGNTRTKRDPYDRKGRRIFNGSPSAAAPCPSGIEEHQNRSTLGGPWFVRVLFVWSKRKTLPCFIDEKGLADINRGRSRQELAIL